MQMNVSMSIFRLAGVLLLALAVSCDVPHHKNADIESSMKYYDHLIQQLDADSISLLYAPDGSLGDVATGRDSIRRFLKTFKNIQVLYQSSTTASIEIKKDTAVQKGNYIQTDVLNDHDTVTVKGEYIATWQWIGNEGWRIKRMETKPAK